MDAQAHLISLGWAGPGHALDSRPQYKQKGHRGLAYNPTLDPLKVGNTGNGLVKPLSISKRKDRFGIGKKAHEPASGTEWWLKGFETALGNIGKPESERSGTSTPTMGSGAKHVGLYGFFVKGQMMEGTISRELVKQAHSKKRKSDALDGDDNGAGSNGVARKTLKMTGLEVSPIRRKPETALDFATVGAFINERDDKEKKHRKKDIEIDVMTRFAQVGKFFEESERVDSKQKKKRKSEAVPEEVPIKDVDGTNSVGRGGIETKEERKERRRQRREEKEKMALLQNGRTKTPQYADDLSENDAARAARKAEKKRRKAAREVRNT